MDRKGWRILLAFLLFIYSLQSIAQKNLIDVPSSEVIEKDQIFFQTQSAITDRNISTSVITTLGLSNKWETGIFINQITFHTRPHTRLVSLDEEEPYKNPDILFHIQKIFKFTEWYKIGIGNRTGISTKRTSDPILVNFSFFNNRFTIPNTKNFLLVGVYYGNNNYVGGNNNLGILLGLQKTIVKDKLVFITDYISGKNPISVINSGLQVTLPKDWKIAVAAELPAPYSGNNYGAVIQITKH